MKVPLFQGTFTAYNPSLFGAPTRGLLLAKYSAEKTKYIDMSQPPHQGDELRRRWTDAKRTLNDAKWTLNDAKMDANRKVSG